MQSALSLGEDPFRGVGALCNGSQAEQGQDTFIMSSKLLALRYAQHLQHAGAGLAH